MSLLKSGHPIQTTGNNLVGLWRPSFVKVDHQLFVYGGGGNVTNDLHVLNLYDMRWETIQTVKGTPPCKRYGHTASLWNNHIIVFGGCNEYQEYCNDIHIFDIDKLTWIQPEINGSVPARYLHSAVVYDDKLFVYGGFAKNSECTYVLDELSVLDLKTLTWSKYLNVPPRYNHSATLVGHKMYIYAGKDEHGNTISDLYVVNLNTPPYTPHLVLSGNANNRMVLLKSQHFCESICGKLLVFGRYLTNNGNTANPDSMYGLWMLDLDTLIWTRQECNANFEVGGWNYFTIVSENTTTQQQHIAEENQVNVNNLFFLGNTDPLRPQGYDHFRDALIINGESIGLYDIAPPQQISSEFAQLLNNQELSDFMIIPAEGGQPFYVHQVILITRWPHFRNIYKSGMLESRQRKMEIPEPYEVVLAFLKYLYNDRLDETESCQIICEVLVLANMYLLHRLKKICCERLYKHHLNISTCGLIFEKAILAEETGLKLLALDFMFKNYGSLLKSDTLLHMSSATRLEFLEAVPDDAILDVSSNRTISNQAQVNKMNPPFIATKPPTTNNHIYTSYTSPSSLYHFDHGNHSSSNNSSGFHLRSSNDLSNDAASSATNANNNNPTSAATTTTAVV